MKIRLILCMALSLGTLCLPSFAQVYKWVDKDGKVQYSDTPPTDTSQVTAKKLDAPSSGLTSAPATKTPAVNGKDAPKDPGKAKEETSAEKANREAEEQKNKEIDAENCREAQTSLRTLDNGTPVRKSNAAGELQYLDTAQREAERARIQQIISESCK